ncbi:hypothetical protein [Pseudomonas phage D6]|nr:hypothetical protein [Pseudomonas phage D6]
MSHNQSPENGKVIVTHELTPHVDFLVDPTPGEEFPEWPRQMFPLQSVTALTYRDVHKAFNDEDTFHSLQAVETITGSGQRRFGIVEDPNPEGNAILMGITVSLAGIIPADQMLALHTAAQVAGHLMMPKKQLSLEGNNYTVFTLIPDYEAFCAAKA